MSDIIVAFDSGGRVVDERERRDWRRPWACFMRGDIQSCCK